MKKIKLTAKELDEKFDEGEEDIIDYFEVVENDGLPKPRPDYTKKKISAELTVELTD